MALMTARIITPIGEDGKPHVGYAQGSQEQAYELDADGEYDVLIYYARRHLRDILWPLIS